MSLLRRKSRSSFAMSQKPRLQGLKGKKQFKAFARRVMCALPWLHKEEAELAEKAQPPTQLKKLEKSRKEISTEVKKILFTPQENRTQENIDALIGYLGHLYFFNQYPKKEHEQLIAKSMLRNFGPGRVILRQGHPVDTYSGLYCVISGNLIVEVETVDPITLHKTSEIVKKLGPSDCFGEAAILFNDLREASVISVTPVELIVVTKGDFDAILKDSLEKEWSKVNNSMKELPYFFGDWGDVEVRRCSIISTLKVFKDGDLILGDGLGKDKEAHFIMEGKCSVVQNILVQTKKNGKFKLIPHDMAKTLGKLNNVREIYMQTSIFTKGACFGVGENRVHRRYVAESDVVCLMIPQYLLLAHKRFDSYRQYLESRLFSEDELFDSFVYLRNRLNYRKKVIDGYKGRAIEINNTTIWDVPYYYRVQSPQIGICKVPEDIVNHANKT